MRCLLHVILSLNILECPVGYYFNNCSKVCSPPSYGDGCQSVCKCPFKDCHFATGCPQQMETVTVYGRLSTFFTHSSMSGCTCRVQITFCLSKYHG